MKKLNERAQLDKQFADGGLIMQGSEKYKSCV
jgi:hypothetical protein